MIRHFWAYRLTDGSFTGEVYGATSATPTWIEMNKRNGRGLIEADSINIECQRVDLETGQVVEFVPDPPEGFIWNPVRRVLEQDPVVLNRVDERNAAVNEIARLETAQHRALRELMLNITDESAVERLRSIDNQIAEQRKRL